MPENATTNPNQKTIIVAGIISFIILLTLICVFFWCRYRRNEKIRRSKSATEERSEADFDVSDDEDDNPAINVPSDDERQSLKAKDDSDINDKVPKNQP